MSSLRDGESRHGIHSINCFALEVPSHDEARRFFETFGLRVEREPESGALTLRAAASGHVWGRLYEGERKRTAYLSLYCFEDDYAGLVEQVRAQGCELVEDGPYADGTGIWFRDPDGNLLQLSVGPKLTGDAPAHRTPEALRPAGVRGVLGRSDTGPVHPARLSHVLMFSTNLDRSIEFYCKALGLRLSDRSQDAVAFMHARHGCDHHLIAFAKSHAPGWHHSSWEVGSVNEVGRGGEQMRDAGYAEGWGTGRHVLGSNFFHYVRDPWGSFAEYSFDIDYVPAGAEWDAGNYPPEDSLYLWGPALPDYFIRNTEARAD
ncbi:MAG: VOC family protein [Candidimonas sp.]